jgi:hypothetical protein
MPESTPGADPDAKAPAEIPGSPIGGPARPSSASDLFHPWALLLIAGLVAGLTAAALGELAHEAFPPAVSPQVLQGNRMMLPTPESSIAALRKNAALTNALLGAVLGLALGLAGGLAGRSAARAAKAAEVGAALGAALGAVASLGLVPLFYYAKQFTETTEPDLSVALALHSGMWTPTGLAAGLAFAIGLGERRKAGRALLGGLLGAFVATLLYEVIGAVFYPLDGTGEPIAQAWQPRALARLLVPLLSALAIGKLVLGPARDEMTKPGKSSHRSDSLA